MPCCHPYNFSSLIFITILAKLTEPMTYDPTQKDVIKRQRDHKIGNGIIKIFFDIWRQILDHRTYFASVILRDFSGTII